MKSFISTLALAASLTLPSAVVAKNVTLTTEMRNYRGPGAYLVLYVTDANDSYMGTVWMAGGKSKYYKHLPNWHRATRGDLAQVAGITGASVGSGRKHELNIDLSDALFDAGYKLHIDTSVEDGRDVANDVVIPLTSANMGKSVRGKRYIKSFTLK